MSRPWRALLMVALASLATLQGLTGVDATVAETCSAASKSDRRVNYDFCVSELNKHRDSPGADTPGLAKVAANMGVNNAGGAVNDMENLLAAKHSPPDARTSAALRLCEQMYYDMELAFAGAYDEINARNCTAGRQVAADADFMVRRCTGSFADAGLQPPEPVARHSAYAVQIAIVCTAITNLIISP
ncbi:hypothetical protein BAE44_0014946 [Dichanthelium oligosanthes]|uniref:Pectinesterase inhibitor domain-containing protein n=1 Tax=Dichanthelium oligosanthes TaxID=888268 RepID=A0A1E5VFW6_9POAL|nr:hypothetical protein BAE44_0014946 [Dichanthelium oligosanthes]